MGKKIGKLIRVVLAFFSIGYALAEPQVTLHITDSMGEKLEQAQVKVPFIIHVNVSNDDGNQLPHPKVHGLKQFVPQGSSQSQGMTMSNGFKTVTQSFQIGALANEQGEYTVGPATIEFDGKVKETDSIVLKVSDKVKTQNDQNDQAFSVVSFDKSTAYIGEELLFTLRFYYTDNKVSLSKIEQPTFENFAMSKLQGPTSGMRTVDGKQYRYLEWTAKVFPEKTGTLTVPPIGAIYFVQNVQRGNNFFGGFVDLFGGGRNKKQLNSNTLEIEVKQLPEHIPPVKAVGKFSSITAHLNNKIAGQGEGVVLTFDLIGAGNIERLAHPTLKLPAGLTSYESSSQIEPEGSEYKKTFEYIVQGLDAGDHTIGAQIFTYFDPEGQEFKTISTEPLSLMVNLGNPKSSVADPSELEEQPKNEKVLTILQGGSWQKVRTRTFPLFLFLFLLLFPLAVLFTLLFLKKRSDYRIINAPKLRYKNAFKKARTSFYNARNGKYDSQLYHIFIELFSARLRLAPTEISEQLIEQTLRKAKISETELIKWRLLFAHMVEQAFSSYGTSARNDGLFNQAIHWLNELEKIL